MTHGRRQCLYASVTRLDDSMRWWHVPVRWQALSPYSCPTVTCTSNCHLSNDRWWGLANDCHMSHDLQHIGSSGKIDYNVLLMLLGSGFMIAKLSFYCHSTETLSSWGKLRGMALRIDEVTQWVTGAYMYCQNDKTNGTNHIQNVLHTICTTRQRMFKIPKKKEEPTSTNSTNCQAKTKILETRTT